MSHKIALCEYDALYPGTAERFDVEGHRIALIRIDDAYFAIGNVCSHAEFLLSDGEVDCDERTIECWKHGALFSLDTGEALTLPATRPVPKYDVVIEDGHVNVVIS